MTFRSPWWLLLLVAVAGLVAGYVVAQRRRTRYAVRFTALPLLDKVAPARPGWRRHAPASAFALLMAALALAVARPATEVQVPRERATVLVAVDTSLSMQADDVKPDRITAAKTAATRFVDDLPREFNVGLVSFAGSANVIVSPTLDRTELRAGIETLSLGNRTAIGEAVFTALDALRTVDALADTDPPPARIVLLSDGENTSGRPPALAAEAARASGVPVATIAYGTPDGTVIDNGRPLRVPVNVEALEDLADATGAPSYRAESGEELAEVYRDIGSSIGWRTEYREITSWVVLVAFVLGLVTAGFSLMWFNRLP